MQKVLAADDIAQLIDGLARQMLAASEVAGAGAGRVALVGIRRRGEIIAQRLAGILQQSLGFAVPVGALDITMYRDDIMGQRNIIIPIGTEMSFRIDDRIVLLVDDVLHTGRSVRAALDALVDFGRPKRIYLAVLVDRQGREYPISADFVGRAMAVGDDSRVRILLAPTDCEDAAYVEEPVKGGAA